MPAAWFDIALLVPNDMPAGRVEEVLRKASHSASGPVLEDLVLLSEFRGTGVDPGFRSLAWRLTFRHPTRTLESREMAGRRQNLIRALEDELGIRQRAS
jgi:phenylalanyl-tRNA synthetase beta chain